MSYRGNRDALERDAEDVVRRIIDGGATISGICAEYHVAYATFQTVYNPRTTSEQREAVKRRNLLRGNVVSRFAKGHTPANKGKKGWCPDGCKKGWFKKGEMRGAAAHNYRAVGSIVVRRDHGNGKGASKRKRRRWIKVKDGGRPQDRSIAYARYVWEREHGPIPAGASIVHVDGDSMNDDPGNLMLIADAAARLKWQKETIPAMNEKRRERCAKAVRVRWKRYRAEKAKLAREAAKLERRAARLERRANRQARAHAEAIKEDKNRGLVSRFRASAIGDGATVWDCPACGNTVTGDCAPDRCMKCGSLALEPRILKSATA